MSVDSPYRRLGLWIALIAIIVLGALGQGLTAAPGLGRMPTTAFIVAAVASAVLLTLQLVATTWVMRMLIAPASRSNLLTLFAWAAVLVVVGAGVSALFAPAGLLVAIAGVFVLPASGQRGAPFGFLAVRRHPWRALALALEVVVFGFVSLVVSIATGLFLTGVAGGLVAWLWCGVVIALLLAAGTRLQERSRFPRLV